MAKEILKLKAFPHLIVRWDGSNSCGIRCRDEFAGLVKYTFDKGLEIRVIGYKNQLSPLVIDNWVRVPVGYSITQLKGKSPGISMTMFSPETLELLINEENYKRAYKELKE